MTNYKNKLSARRGFTLIELLIVIAILGVLAVVVLVALNPVQQLARTRDAGRIQTVATLGHAIEAKATADGGTYLPPSATWVTALQTAGELGAVIPSVPAYTAPGTNGRAKSDNCTTGVQAGTGLCYQAYPAGGPYTSAIVYATLESGANTGRCAGTMGAFAVYSTLNSKGGVLCTAAPGTMPAAPPATTGYPTCVLNAAGQCATANTLLP